MKIVMICEFYNENLEYQENLLAKFYRQAGHSVTVITSTFESVFDYYQDRHDSNVKPSVAFLDTAKIIRLRYKYNLFNKVRRYTSIYGILQDEAPDLIFVHDIIPNLTEIAKYAKRNDNCKVIMDYHADFSNSGANWLSIKILHGVIRKYFLRRARPFIKKIYPVVPDGAEFLNKVYGISYSEMELLPLGTDLEYGRSVVAEGARSQIRADLGIPPDALVVFTGGKLSPLKMTERLIEAVRVLGRPDIHLIIVGDADGADADYAAAIRRQAGSTAHVHMVGWQDKRGVYRHLAAADIAVFPASQSVLWQQAVGMGLPLIVSERSELLRGCQDISYMNLHENIIVLDPALELPAQIAHHLGRLADDREKLRLMSEGARRVGAELLDWSILVQKTLDFST